ncbi:hypothetical protein BDZ89DRAFT_1055391, partial [Hymenopellis radicata]
MDPIPDFCNFKLHQLPEFAHPERSAGRYRTAMIILDLHIAVQLYRDFNSFVVVGRTAHGFGILDHTLWLRDGMELGPGHDYDSPLLRLRNPFLVSATTYRHPSWTIAELHSTRFHDTLVTYHFTRLRSLILTCTGCTVSWFPACLLCDNLLIEPDALSAPNRELVEWWEDYQSRRYQATPARFIRRHLAPPEPVP